MKFYNLSLLTLGYVQGTFIPSSETQGSRFNQLNDLLIKSINSNEVQGRLNEIQHGLEVAKTTLEKNINDLNHQESDEEHRIPSSITGMNGAGPARRGPPGGRFPELQKESDSINEGLQHLQNAERALLQADMGLVNQYGCWCFFEDDHGRGRGEPQDEIDQICKTLHHGYDCIIKDQEEKGTPCVPWEVSYNSAFGGGFQPFGFNIPNLNGECEDVNIKGSCECATCKVEGYFVQSYFSYAIFGGGIDRSMRHAEGFDYEGTCDVKFAAGTRGSLEEDCCGEYPIRYPYLHGGEKDCCLQTVFNTGLFSCCDDGSVQFTCL